MEEDWGDGNQRRRSFIRWQQITLQQFSYVMNLLLAFSGASIGFEMSTYLNRNFSLSDCEKCFYLASLVLLSLSIVLGLIASVTRLFDFRYTTRLARARWKLPEGLSKIGVLEDLTDHLGKWSWRLFGGQVSSFALGVLSVAVVYFEFILG